MSWERTAATNIAVTTNSAEHHPLPYHPVSALDLFLPVEIRPSHQPRWSWFKTGLVVGIGLSASVAAAICRFA